MTTTTITMSSKKPLDIAPDASARQRTLNDIVRMLEAFSGGVWGTGDQLTIQYDKNDSAATASATLTFASVSAGSVLLVNGVSFTAVSGTPVRANNEFKVGVSNTADAADFVVAFNASTSTGITGVLTAASALAVITITALDPGLPGNECTIETYGIVASGTVTLASVLANDTVTIGGVALTAKTASPAAHQWLVGVSNTADAAALAALINSDTSTGLKGFVRATSAAAVVTVYSLIGGPAGNTITLASSNSGRLAVSGARLTGGAIAQYTGVAASGTWTTASGSGVMGVALNGVAITVTWATSDTATATALASAINNSTNALVSGLVTATSAAGVVTITATQGGPPGNAITLATSGVGTGQSVSGANLAGGALPTQVVVGGGATQENPAAFWRLGGGTGDVAPAVVITQ